MRTASASRAAASVSAGSGSPVAWMAAPPKRCSSSSRSSGELREDAGGRGRDLRPDPVAGEEGDPHCSPRVTAPSEAEETSAAYLASTPFV